MNPLLVGLLVVGGGAVAVVASSSSSPSTDGRAVLPRKIPRINLDGPILRRVVPPPPGAAPFAPNGVPFVWGDAGGDYTPGAGRHAIDATAQQWLSVWREDPPPDGYRLCDVSEMGKKPKPGGLLCWPAGGPVGGRGRWEWAEGGAGPGWQEAAFDIAKTVWTVAATAAGAAVGAGVGGAGAIAVAFATKTVVELANGASLTSAVVQAASEQAKTQAEKSTFYRTFQAISASPYTESAVAAYRQARINEASPSNRAAIANSIDAAIAVGQAKRVQDLAIAKLKTHLATDEEREWLRKCLEAGSDLPTWVFALYGEPGAKLLEQIVSEATETVRKGAA